MLFTRRNFSDIFTFVVAFFFHILYYVLDNTLCIYIYIYRLQVIKIHMHTPINTTLSIYTVRPYVSALYIYICTATNALMCAHRQTFLLKENYTTRFRLQFSRCDRAHNAHFCWKIQNSVFFLSFCVN